MKKIIINADDFGLTTSCNKGIIESIINGVVSNTTLMVNMPKAEEAILLAKENGIDTLGIHLTLTCGKPILPQQQVRSLVDEEGNFYRRSTRLLPVMKLDEVESELRMQIDTFLKCGLKISHLDSHHHVHMHDGILEIVAGLAKEYNLPLRQPSERAKKLYKEMNITTTDHFTLEFYGEGANLENLKTIINGFEKGILEVMVHPAYVDEDLKSISSYNNYRKKELEILTSGVLKVWLDQNNIQVISFEDLGS
ncbi:YdjC family protein [Alkaliphilus metalliredigens QYMF]|uniref:YdjC family protein n=1 Tax=Alkaliphilus metalliredigens (strain QYMF) TaxID=293826 RepID=A6TVP7_ALKMQ|nr:chitin disaccharide deacetylase [Alkaliphilus metalliredigens]ABR50265.1 YdjC family protein [Alkaliphilus metalliredigens QYMF]